jgi:hypothetical protein
MRPTRALIERGAYEMLARRDEANLMNEILNKHVILHGAELFYRLILMGRR